MNIMQRKRLVSRELVELAARQDIDEYYSKGNI